MLAAPESLVLQRTRILLQGMAAENVFVPLQNERIRQIHPPGVRIWRVREGHPANRTPGGVANMQLPAILITAIPTEYRGTGLNCADDEAVTVVLQIVENAPQSAGTDAFTYAEWMGLIRKELLKAPNPFLQDAIPGRYDPWHVIIAQRSTADAEALVRSEQNVASMVFQVLVRHHR